MTTVIIMMEGVYGGFDGLHDHTNGNDGWLAGVNRSCNILVLGPGPHW